MTFIASLTLSSMILEGLHDAFARRFTPVNMPLHSIIESEYEKYEYEYQYTKSQTKPQKKYERM